VRQILQSLQTGTTEVAEVPRPAVSRGQLLIETSRTLISAGTERMLVEFGQASLLGKARQQPERVKMVLDKIRTDGLGPTIAAVRNKLDLPAALGYCNAGVVAEVGAGVAGFAVGDRVASNGKHAEVVCVPANLCAKVPDGIPDEQAAFTVLAAVGLQGVRLAQPTLGEAVAVTGLGLIGLVTVQLLRAQGCRVLGIDMDPAKLALARRFGAETVDLSAGGDPVAAAETFSRGRGMDAVVITAATHSDEPVHQAALMCRQRGRIVLVGVTGLHLSRDDFYRKELTFQVSAAYGPGRYDPNYEEKNQDYPVGFVRWTAQRNFEAVLDQMAAGCLDVAPLISHRFPVGDAARAYALLAEGAQTLGIVLEYPAPPSGAPGRTVSLAATAAAPTGRAGTAGAQAPAVSFIGAGNYATGILIPAFKAAGAALRVVASNSGVSGLHAGRKFGFAETTTDTAKVLADPATGTVVVTTRHDSHARFVLEALRAGKNVFVEKPLCLTLEELAEIESLHRRLAEQGSAPRVMVGFNRRFAPQVVKMKALLAGVAAPKALVMTVNAGAIPADHWTQDPDVGGGRVAGEGCHFIDLLRFLAGAAITGHSVAPMASPTADTVTIQLAFADGSIGTVHYFANGTKSFPKERLEVFAAGRVLQLDNYRRLTGYGWPNFTSMNLWKQDKGQRACAAAYVRAATEGLPAPIPFEEIVEVSRVTIEAGARR
jgi:predicted dehydrogenase/threonine dehydrogenase-like Zn-dependent dehydrogenase